MRLVQMKRGEGKTTLMLDWLSQNPNRVLIVTTEHEARLLKRQCDTPDRIFSVALWKDTVGIKVEEVGVDNVDRVLEYLLRHRVSVATLTNEEIN